MKLTNELMFVYQLFISCTKYHLKDEDTILYMNNIIKVNNINHKLIDKKSLKELRRTVKRYLTDYNKLKVKDSCYNNPKMLGLLWISEQNRIINSYNFGTDLLVKQEYNKHHHKNNVI